MPRYILLFYLFFLFGIYGISYSQEITSNDLDSLVNLDFKKLHDGFYNTIHTKTLNATLFAKAYLLKAKRNKNAVETAVGYYFMSKFYPENLEKRIVFIDSAITVSMNTKHKKFPGFFHLHKGFLYGRYGSFDKSLDFYLEGLEFAKQTNNDYYVPVLNHNIALLKRKLGKYEEAKSLFKKNLVYRESRMGKKQNDSLPYLSNLSELVTTHRRNKELDSARYFNRLGMQMSRGKTIQSLFRLNKGILQYYNKEYTSAIQNINSAIAEFTIPENRGSYYENYNIIEGYYFLGKSFNALSKKEIGITYFKKIDSVVQHSKYVIIEAQLAYEEIIKYYKSKNDKNNQLYYINRLIDNDSILDSNFGDLNSKLIKYYDTPQLINQKEQLIAELQTKKNRSYYGLVLLSIIIIIVTTVLCMSYQKNKKYKKRFKELMDSSKKESLDKNEPTFIEEDTSIGIAEDVVKVILEELDDFEKKNGFLNTNITSVLLSKKMNTNAKYLTKVIKYYRQKNFSPYINDLRIAYITKELKTNTKLQKYTIKALATEAGFNSTEIFSKAFYKKNGIYPSYFIKRIHAKENY